MKITATRYAAAALAYALLAVACLLAGTAITYLVADNPSLASGLRFGAIYLAVITVLAVIAHVLTSATQTITAIVLTTATISVATTICIITNNSDTRLTAAIILILAAVSFLGHTIDLHAATNRAPREPTP